MDGSRRTDGMGHKPIWKRLRDVQYSLCGCVCVCVCIALNIIPQHVTQPVPVLWPVVVVPLTEQNLVAKRVNE